MPEQHVQLMKGLGLDEETIKAVEALTPEQIKAWKADDPEQLKVFNPNDIVSKVQSGMKNTLMNDAAFLASIPKDKISPEILKEVEKGQYARFQNELLDVATKKLGLDGKTDLTDEDRKSISKLTEKIATAYMTKNGNVEGLQKMQQQLQKALEENETLKTGNEAATKKQIEELNGKHSMKLIKTLTKVELQGLDGVKLAVSANFVSDPVLNAMNAKYAIVLDDNDNLSLKQKENPALDVLDKTGKKVTFQQAMKETVLELKLGTEEKVDPNDPDNKKKKKVIVDGGAGGDDVVELPAHIQSKIDQNGGA